MLCSLIDVFPTLAFIAQHDERASTNSVALQHRDNFAHSGDIGAPVHCIQNALRSTLGADPQAVAAEIGKQLHHFFVESVLTGYRLKRKMQIAPLEFIAILTQPVSAHREHIVRVPDLVGCIRIANMFQLVGDIPARDAIDMRPYLDTWRTHHGSSSVSLITARGCPYTCRWCSHSVYGFTFRHRSPRERTIIQWFDLLARPCR